MSHFVFGQLPNAQGELQFTDPLTRLCLGDQALFFTTGQDPIEVLREQFFEALEICAPAGPVDEKTARPAGPTDPPAGPKVLFVRPGCPRRFETITPDPAGSAAWYAGRYNPGK